MQPTVGAGGGLHPPYGLLWRPRWDANQTVNASKVIRPSATATTVSSIRSSGASVTEYPLRSIINSVTSNAVRLFPSTNPWFRARGFKQGGGFLRDGTVVAGIGPTNCGLDAGQVQNPCAAAIKHCFIRGRDHIVERNAVVPHLAGFSRFSASLWADDTAFRT